MNKVLRFLFLLLIYLSFGLKPVEGSYKLIEHDLQIELDPHGHSFSAIDILTLDADEETVFLSFNTKFQIHFVKIGPRVAGTPPSEVIPARPSMAGKEGIEVSIPPTLRGKKIVLVIAYSGVLYEPLDPFSEPSATITPEFMYLSPRARWYPDLVGSLGVFKITAVLPKGYEVITHGSLRERKEVEYDDAMKGTEKEARNCFVWEADYPADNCYLIAAPYRINHLRHGDIDLYTYFFPEEQGLAESYLESCKKYLDMYQKLIGQYPFSKFAVVENFFPTGYGMPSYTLLGRQVLTMPFIVHISLGHEILHNWWGNSVIPDPEYGSWCEGLTSYLADYYYKELIGPVPAMEYRRDLLRGYANYITEENDFALESFGGISAPRTEKATRSILYGKAAMIFHMLRKRLGDEHFFQALRNLYVEKKWQLTTWEDVRVVFEHQSGNVLDWYFKQWVSQKGAPLIELGEVRLTKENGTFQMSFQIKQGVPAYRLSVPVALSNQEGVQISSVELDSPSKTFSIPSPSRPVKLAVDPELDLFRKLHPLELPPTLDKALGDPTLLIVKPSGGNQQLLKEYATAAEMLMPHGEIKIDKEITDSDLNRSLFILGGPDSNLLLKKFTNFLPSDFAPSDDGFTFQDKKYEAEASLVLSYHNPFSKEKTVCVFYCQEPTVLRSIARKILHYGKFSYVVFVDGTSIDKGMSPEEATPLVHYF